MAPVTRVSASGRVIRVAPNFAYVSSSAYGGVFVPPCAILPPDCLNPDLSLYVKSGDVVHFNANKQPTMKNGCQYIATKVTLSHNNLLEWESNPTPPSPDVSVDSEEVFDNLGCITQVNETYAFIYSESIDGVVFFPGSAYKSSDTLHERPRLNAHLKSGDIVQFNARKQTPKNGCHYLALLVTKLSNLDVQKESNEELSEADKADKADKDKGLVNQADCVTHEGVVVVICEDYGYLFSEQLCGNVYFQVGACRSVQEWSMLYPNTKVHFVAVPQCEKSGCSWKALRVTPVVDVFTEDFSSHQDMHTQTEPVTILSQPKKFDSVKVDKGNNGKRQPKSVQTPIRAEDLLLSAIQSQPDVMQLMQSKFPYLMQYCYSTPVQVVSNRVRDKQSMHEHVKID